MYIFMYNYTYIFTMYLFPHMRSVLNLCRARFTVACVGIQTSPYGGWKRCEWNPKHGFVL